MTQNPIPKQSLWWKVALSALSGVLLTLSMPGFDVPLVGWVALVPVLIVLLTAESRQVYLLALPFGLLFSIGVHNWYPHIFPPALGYFLIVAVGSFYAGMLQLGVWLTHRLPKSLNLFALPVAWTAVEFLKFIAPVVNDWWFVLLAKSQWQFPPALQILSITGFPGLSFLVMLVNVAVAFGVLIVVSGRYSVVSKQFSVGDRLITDYRLLITALTAVAAILLWGAISMGDAPSETFTIAALTDMVNQDPDIQVFWRRRGLCG